MRSLTMSEASTRAASIRVMSYDVQLDLTQADERFGSSCVIEFASLDGQDTFVDIKPAVLHHVQLNGQQQEVESLLDGRLHLAGLQGDNTLVVEAAMAYSHDGEGLHRSVDPEDGLTYLYGMSFLPAAPRIFACFDQPDLKAPYRISVKAPTDWVVLGNAHATQTAPGNWELAVSQPLATYFTTVVAGPYHSVTTSHDGIALGLHCRQSLAPHLDKDAEEMFTVTRQCFDEYHRLFGIRYPFGDYHQVFVPEFNAGAMENPGCVTFRDELIFKAQATSALRTSRANVIAHEMAHQWFGNLVTMRWWDDLWLNESFAEYMAYRVTTDVTGFDDAWVEFALSRKAWGMAADQRMSTHPIAGNGASDAEQALSSFDGISYTKGASALRQLNSYLGDEAFLAGVVDHLQRNSYGNATLADLLDSWQRHSDKDVTAWADAWLRTSGIDTLSVAAPPAGEPVIERHNGSPHHVSRPHAITVSSYGADGSGEATPLVLSGSATPVSLTSYDGSGLVLPDSGDESWVKVRLDPATLDRVPEALRSIDDAVSRAVLWGSLREGLRDGELAPRRYLEILGAALPAEDDLAIDAVLNGAVSYVGTFLPHLSAAEHLASVASAILHVSQPGSNRQLVAARALIKLTADHDLLRKWRDGESPAGLVADEDLHWRLTSALCAAGQLGVDDIAVEMQRDPSSQGALRALECRASLPDAATKAEVWQAIVSDASLSNYSLYALADNFFRPDQLELTAEYVPRYFDELPRGAALRTGWVVERVAHFAYPRYTVNHEAVLLAEECLAHSQLDPGTRHSISDNLDDLRRSLVIRERFLDRADRSA
ncbi:MAG: aminopeptidase N [Actinomycetota bacterium]|nr:aminopeptidase N [Nocardioidaceae bacterium]MDQ3479791.1 aminopeptidase N [Actinomycetota bacterium]